MKKLFVPTYNPQLETRVVPDTGIVLHKGNWELWYRGVLFSSNEDLGYCVKKMQVLMKEDDFGTDDDE